MLDMFPYPSGDGLHVGHPEGYTATDIVCRFERMRGKAVLHPMGFDAFGLPAEEHAIKTNTPPRVSTEKNIANFRRQLKMLGFSYDWERELATTDVDYFRWTQWIFLVLFDTWFDPSSSGGGRSPNCRFPPMCKRPGRTGRAPLSGRTSAGLSRRRAGQLVPRAGDRAGQRRSDRRQERTRRPSRAAHPAAAMDAAHHRLCRSTGAGPRRARLVRQHQEAATRLDWPQHGAEVDFFIGRRKLQCRVPGKCARDAHQGWPAASRATMSCASTPRGPIRCSVQPTWSSRRNIRSSSD